MTLGLLPGVSGPATAEVEPSIHPELAEHTKHFEKKIYRIGDNVYSAVGWHLANTIVIEGDDGIIVVDTGEDIETARMVEKEYRKITKKPVRAVIYTHFHPDHINGVKAWTTPEAVRRGDVQIIAHETLVENVTRQGALMGPILAVRSAYSFGSALPPADTEGMNGGIGPKVLSAQATFIAPTVTFRDRLETTIAGVDLVLTHVPSEAPDEICVYLPKENILCSGETIQGPTLPNIHTLRGTKFRDPVKWFKSIDVLRAFNAEYLVPAHGQPQYGAERVEEVLRMTRDGVQFIHDQTVRYMNKGLTADELVEVVKFPPHLAEYSPYLREYYGTVKHAVRQIYNGYLGWFSGDPVDLDPTPPVERARRHVSMMGGRDAVVEAARRANELGEYQWAAELATYAIRIDHGDIEARAIKAEAFRYLGYASMNINWRNWYLTSAQELEGNLDALQLMLVMARAFSSPDIIQALPVSRTIEAFTARLKAEETLDVHVTVGFLFTDIGEGYGLEIRRGICQFHPRFPEKTDASLILTKKTLDRVLMGELNIPAAIQAGDIQVAGNAGVAATFLGYFEGAPTEGIVLTLR
ncbi:MAG: MBL fold metallo-hydrolase [Candidatus Hydrogenedentes bacterium]|nr:MBL fold metallo-hydrolase [Candidatus Hydrogenedentota bacterium]